MRQTTRFAISAIVLATAHFAGCAERSVYVKVEPAKVEHQGEIGKLTLTKEAIARLDIQTASVQAAQAGDADKESVRAAVPYSAIVYAPTGQEFVYASPEPRVFVRQPVIVDYIEGDVAVLKSGPPPGTLVASVGAAELLGTEVGVGH